MKNSLIVTAIIGCYGVGSYIFGYFIGHRIGFIKGQTDAIEMVTEDLTKIAERAKMITEETKTLIDDERKGTYSYS